MTLSLLVCVGLLAAPFVLAPFLVRATHKAAARPTFEPVDPETGRIPEEPWLFFMRTLNALSGAGFTEAGYLHQSGYTPNVESWLLLLENRPRQEAAIAAAIDATTGGIKSRYVEFSANFQDGVSVSANNSDVIPAFAPVAGKHTLQFPDVADPLRLHRIHLALVARLGSRSRRRYPAEGQFVEFLIESMTREMERQVGTGYLVLDGQGVFYRATWKGAFLMTWKLLWPVSTILKARRCRRNARLLADLGL